MDKHWNLAEHTFIGMMSKHLKAYRIGLAHGMATLTEQIRQRQP